MAATKASLRFNPDARPLGCNGKYGASGVRKHRYHGETPCERCLKSFNHYRRDKRRGGRGTPLKLQPCGTPAARARHVRNGEPIDFACRLAHANMNREYRKRKREREAEAA